MKNKHLIVVRMLLVLIVAVILLFAFSPGQLTPAWIVNHDKFSHMAAFAVLFFIIKFGFPLCKNTMVISFLVLMTIVIESLQYGFFNRGFSIADILYGIVGIMIAGTLVYVFKYLQLSDSQ